MAELSKDTKAVVEDALDAADRKALQQAAKAVGVKANGTSVSIIAQLKAWLTTTAAPDASAPPPPAAAAPAATPVVVANQPRSPASTTATDTPEAATPASRVGRAEFLSAVLWGT